MFGVCEECAYSVSVPGCKKCVGCQCKQSAFYERLTPKIFTCEHWLSEWDIEQEVDTNG